MRRAHLGHEQLVFDGRVVTLCRVHAVQAADAHVETLEDLRLLFVGWGAKAEGSAERRSPILRRGVEDRRALPLRPEGRRLGTGRRASDLEE